MAWIRVAEFESGQAFLELDVVNRRVQAVKVHNETDRVMVIVARDLGGTRSVISREFLAPGGIELTRTIPAGLRSRLDIGTNEEPVPVVPATFSISAHMLGPGQDESAI